MATPKKKKRAKKKLRSKSRSRVKPLLKKSVRRNKLAMGVLIAAIVLAIMLALLGLFIFGFFEQPGAEERFVLQDECNLVMGNLIHQIRTDGDCIIRCRNECELREMDFVRMEFVPQNNSCHDCDCYCR